LFVGIAPVVFNLIVRSIMDGITHTSLGGIFSLTYIITAIVQLLLAFIIFRLMDQREESLSAWLFIVTISGVINYMFVPNTIPLIVSSFS
jgi:hypothetical protein